MNRFHCNLSAGPKKRGRPRKKESDHGSQAQAAKKRGRPRKSEKKAVKVELDSENEESLLGLDVCFTDVPSPLESAIKVEPYIFYCTYF
jgi:hypothetical protein